jgi:hypothetical protein
MTCRRWKLAAWLALCMPVTLWSAGPCPGSRLDAGEIVNQWVNRSQATAKELTGYASTRHYHLEFHGVKSAVADLVVRVLYYAPEGKQFSIQSAGGSGFLQRHVLDKLLATEIQASRPENRQKTAWTPANYAFRLLGCEEVAGRMSYVLGVNPRHESKFLVRGKIDVDRQDFALIRLTAEPATNPSWWTVRNEIEQTYAKTQGFWLPFRNTTLTKVRFLGHTQLTIDYGEYRLIPKADPHHNLPATQGYHDRISSRNVKDWPPRGLLAAHQER